MGDPTRVLDELERIERRGPTHKNLSAVLHRVFPALLRVARAVGVAMRDDCWDAQNTGMIAGAYLALAEVKL